jgi:hypothetical protein
MPVKTRDRPTLATITDNEREHLETCIHEAGHAVAAVALGARLWNSVAVNSRWAGVQGRTEYEEDMPPGAHVQAAYAGPYAQARFAAGGRRPTQRELFALWEGHGRLDCRMLTAAGGTHLGAAVVPLLERCWPAIVRTAQQLKEQREVFHDDVCKALGITDGGGPTSVQLASLRTGWGREVPPLGVPA